MTRRGTRVIWRKLDCLKPNLQMMQKKHPPERAPGTGATLCAGMAEGSAQPPERGAMPSEGI
jgi:hypothetical protein